MSDISTTASIGAIQKAIISKILVAIDGSAASMEAADYATSISKKYNAELYALHVIRSDLAAETSESFMTRMTKEDEEYMNKVKVNADEKKIQIKTEIIPSINTAGGILDYADNFIVPIFRFTLSSIFSNSNGFFFIIFAL
jgi:nucleotide-binding universal stress UspA family protein